MSWLDSVWNAVTSFATSSTLLDFATSTIGTTLIGAGVGALATAVSGGDISDGLLYGAVGGLVVGGLTNYGDKVFGSSWYSGKDTYDDPGTLFQSTSTMSDGATSISMNENVAGLNIGQTAAGAAKNVAGQVATTGGGLLSKIGDETIAAGLTLGGSALMGAFGGETADDKMVELKEKEMQLAQEDKKATEAKQAAALKSYNADNTALGTYKEGLSVDEQLQNRMLTGFSKESAGVTTG